VEGEEHQLTSVRSLSHHVIFLIHLSPGQDLYHIANVRLYNSYPYMSVLFLLFFHSLSPQRLAYSPDTPVGDAAKLYWHFFRVDQSGAAGVIITLFLYAVIFLLSVTILFINMLRSDVQEGGDGKQI